MCAHAVGNCAKRRVIMHSIIIFKDREGRKKKSMRNITPTITQCEKDVYPSL